jgi:hypothetical protein
MSAFFITPAQAGDGKVAGRHGMLTVAAHEAAFSWHSWLPRPGLCPTWRSTCPGLPGSWARRARRGYARSLRLPSFEASLIGLEAPTRVQPNTAARRGSAHMVPPTPPRLGVGPGFRGLRLSGAWTYTCINWLRTLAFVRARLHRAVSNLKSWLRGTHGVSRDHLQVYLGEFVFRFNRRGSPMAAFQTLLGLGTVHSPTTYKQITRRNQAAA